MNGRDYNLLRYGDCVAWYLIIITCALRLVDSFRWMHQVCSKVGNWLTNCLLLHPISHHHESLKSYS